jgi:hypothetical protein
VLVGPASFKTALRTVVPMAVGALTAIKLAVEIWQLIH